jgi:hypothetical protein
VKTLITLNKPIKLASKAIQIAYGIGIRPHAVFAKKTTF